MTGARGEIRIQFNGDHLARGLDHLGEDSGVISDAATSMVNTGPGFKIEFSDPARKAAGVSVVEIAGGVYGNQGVVVEITEIISRGV